MATRVGGQGATTKAPSLSAIAEETAAATTVLDELMAPSGLPSGHPERDLAARGLAELLRYALGHDLGPRLLDVPLCDLLLAELLDKITRQIDVILHHPTFQALEAAWRGLAFVVDRTDFRENIRVELLNVSKQDLLEDFQDAPEIPKSGLYRLVYSTEFGQFGGRPFGLMVANYELTPQTQDMYLLDQCAAVATMAHAPFIAAASPRFFGLDEFARLPQLPELRAMFEGPQYTKWRAFRDHDDSRFVGLCMPRFLLRLPYGPGSVRVDAFEYEEDVVGRHDHYLWGNASYAFATRVADSFARYRWCPNIIGPSGGGTVDDLPLHEYEALGAIQTKIPTEVMITEKREWDLAEQGFISLVYRRESDNACFFSANSVQRPKTYGISEVGEGAAINHKLGTQLPYLFITCRLAHYLKVMQREQIGGWKERLDLERELQGWINQYVSAQAVASAAVRARRPLREAKVTVREVDGNAGWYKIDLQVRPHFKYMGAVFELGLVGRLDKD